MTSIETVREKVKSILSEKRFQHTLSVAESAVKLAEFCKCGSKYEAEIASLLHDITKEYPLQKQLQIIEEENITIDTEDFDSVGVLHSFTAPAVIKADFSEFATKNIISAVKHHTLGSPDMTVFDEIIFLADFIEETRTYEACVDVRQFVFSNMKQGKAEDNILILHNACIKAIDATVINLINNNKPINSKNILTRNALLSKI